MTDSVLTSKPILDRFRLDGRVALVTGAGQGIGRGYAHGLGEAGAAVAVVDAEGNALADGDAVTLVKDLKVKGTSTTLKRGTVIRSIRLTDDPDLVDCRHETIKGLVLRTEFVRKR